MMKSFSCSPFIFLVRSGDLAETEGHSNKAKRFLKIAEAKHAFDAVAIIAQFPIRSLRLKTLRFLVRERRDATATRSAFLFGESCSHVRPSDLEYFAANRAAFLQEDQ
jgi:hypothetical protein